jgi:predicted enzyme related to lactoylglutathione lyase
MSNAEIRGRFIWHELLTTDTAAAAAFYPRVLPWRTQPSSMPGYTIWMAAQTQIGGLMALPAERGRHLRAGAGARSEGAQGRPRYPERRALRGAG